MDLRTDGRVLEDGLCAGDDEEEPATDSVVSMALPFVWGMGSSCTVAVGTLSVTTVEGTSDLSSATSEDMMADVGEGDGSSAGAMITRGRGIPLTGTGETVSYWGMVPFMDVALGRSASRLGESFRAAYFSRSKESRC